ncbi:Histidine--tRNA ligase [Desulfamplus magnetovallimortis]|uniref:Histidine--tRNA ligase n=1 Tax=Desulfamplus magnetovallimortis TaxID=1246637 RepID=A0A1W1HGX4_9BACT|nr:histidine--tRNA ligase [Desulfamplus magnetovallimortis]SLM31632.1 Histidine--tRNA ligase [Desulfamplus magnetovallimortis]
MIQTIRGFRDILPKDTALWQHIEKTASELFENFGFQEIRIPIMEKTELFARSIGEATDIVEKEMYTFPDRKGDKLTLRPEATASVVRSYIQHKMHTSDPVQKLYTIGPMFRRERPQKGRYRQFYQINAEVFGIAAPYIDAQLILILNELFRRLGLSDLKAHVNSLGCPACRPDFQKALLEFLSDKKDELCENCIRRMDKNPLRTLDCKVPKCREALKDAPSTLGHLCSECEEHFGTVQRALKQQNVEFVVDKTLVRGLDYYSRTTFEILTTALGAQSAVAGGGRYDALIKELDGPEMPGIGFAIGLDRLAEIVEQLEKKYTAMPPDLFIIPLGDRATEYGYLWSSALSIAGVKTEMDFSGRSLKSLMKRADKLNAGHVLIAGDKEIDENALVLRDMATREQHDISMDNPVEQIVAILRK